jgi:hypothetical protein
MAWIGYEGWTHGRVWKGKAGRLSFYIRRGGKDVATGSTTLSGALAALERYEKSGDALVPEDAGPVVLDAKLAADFLAHLKAKGDSVGWRRNVRQHLAWWERRPTADKPGAGIGGLDLRAGRRNSVSISALRAALEDAPSARQREAVIRALYGFLRGEDRITTEEDPLYGKPRISPAGRPAQDMIDKSIPGEDVEKVRKHLEAEYLRKGRTGRRWADLVMVLDGTGMHVTELRRFAADGVIEPLPGDRKPTPEEAGVLVVPLHKSGSPWRVAVSAEVLEVAKRVREAGSFSIAVFYSELRKAADATGAKVLPGRFRHSTAKHAIEAGATIGEIGTFLGHRSASTTKRFYASLGVAMKIPTRR